MEDFVVNSLHKEFQLTIAEKDRVISAALNTASHALLHVFMFCGLKDGMYCKVRNEPTDEWFAISFEKTEAPSDYKKGDHE